MTRPQLKLSDYNELGMLIAIERLIEALLDAYPTRAMEALEWLEHEARETRLRIKRNKQAADELECAQAILRIAGRSPRKRQRIMELVNQMAGVKDSG